MNSLEIALRIQQHLDRDEAGHYLPVTMVCSGTVRIRYTERGGVSSLGLEEARAYLAWMDAGNIGTHWEFRAINRQKSDATTS